MAPGTDPVVAGGGNGASDDSQEVKDLVAIELWRLPTNFFSLTADEQWKAFASITSPAKKRTEPLPPCPMTLDEEALAIAYFLVLLGGPLCLPGITIALALLRPWYCAYWFALVGVVAAHPLPQFKAWCRRNRLGVVLAKYFTITCFIDRGIPEVQHAGTPKIDENLYSGPLICLACPHGVLNFGAVVWLFFSRFICGRDQYTVGAGVVTKVPGLRHGVLPMWVIPADRGSLKRRLQEKPWDELEDDAGADSGPDAKKKVVRRGGMFGIVPDGIAGIFKSKPGEDVLFIGKKRGLMRIALEEGALICAGWFSGTSELFHIVVDPFGIMEWTSRKLKMSLFLFFGRWGTPVPRRVTVSMSSYIVRCEKKAAPTDEEVEALHQKVYGGLSRRYDVLKHYAGHPDRHLAIK